MIKIIKTLIKILNFNQNIQIFLNFQPNLTFKTHRVKHLKQQISLLLNLIQKPNIQLQCKQNDMKNPIK